MAALPDNSWTIAVAEPQDGQPEQEQPPQEPPQDGQLELGPGQQPQDGKPGPEQLQEAPEEPPTYTGLRLLSGMMF